MGKTSTKSTAAAAVISYFALEQPRLRAYIRSIVFNASDVDDLMQDVAVTAVENADRYDPAHPVSAWVIGIARNRIRKYLDGVGKQHVTLSPDVIDAITDAACHANDQGDLLESLQRCLGRLRQQQRTLLLRRHQQGVTARELARKLGYSDSRMSRLLNSLYVALKQCIEQRHAGGQQ